jgi:pimeloyl-ACP methyl ester carboxylesterase
MGKYGVHNTRYTSCTADRSGSMLPLFGRNGKKVPVVCVHGFGGNADQFRKNLPVLASEGHDSYAIDLLGFGYSDKVCYQLMVGRKSTR